MYFFFRKWVSQENPFPVWKISRFCMETVVFQRYPDFIMFSNLMASNLEFGPESRVKEERTSSDVGKS